MGIAETIFPDQQFLEDLAKQRQLKSELVSGSLLQPMQWFEPHSLQISDAKQIYLYGQTI